MRKTIVAAVAVFAIAGDALAIEPQMNWSGFYAGIDLGGLSAKTPTTIPALPITADIEPSGFIAGGHLGYRWHTPGSRWVFGVEADFWGVRAADDAEFVGFGNSTRVDMKWGGSLRGVAGRAINSTLLYVTGGVAYANFDGCVLSLLGGCWQSYSDTRLGWTAGLGLAHAFRPNLIARLEYLYSDYGDQSYATPAVVGGVTNVEIRTHVLRGGLSWRFATR